MKMKCKSYGHNSFIYKLLGWKKIEKEVRMDGVKKGGKVGVEVASLETVHYKPKGAVMDNSPPSPSIQGAHPTGCVPCPTGSHGQNTAQGAGKAADVVQGAAKTVQESTTIVQKIQEPPKVIQPIQSKGDSLEEDNEVMVEDNERIVTDVKDLHQYDVVTKCEVIKGNTLKLFVKPFRFVHISVIRVDTSLRLTDDLDNKGLTFTAKCFERLPGVTKKKGEVCFDSKFTTPFRNFFG
ncbi:unnamed protein product [Cuscuta europaea]|uniref:Uncharacterized protein n=1 Tax=Cuscuta europaea TaxID=41803 RepID=A0A9P1E2R2_CUSEU|nr:unnamed protein product [Cuscuta europaea]